MRGEIAVKKKTLWLLCLPLLLLLSGLCVQLWRQRPRQVAATQVFIKK